MPTGYSTGDGGTGGKCPPISYWARTSLVKAAWELARFGNNRYLCHLVEALHLVLPQTVAPICLWASDQYVDLAISDRRQNPCEKYKPESTGTSTK